MPSEKINYPQPVKMHHSCGLPTEDDDGPCTCTPTADTMPSIHVRWGAGGHDKLTISNVQIVLTKHEQPAWDEWIKTDPYAGPSAFPAPPVAEDVYSAVLSRSELNKMIKVLRRARDQAYGTDE